MDLNIIELLDTKVDGLLGKYKDLEEENAELKTTIETLKQEISAKENTTATLQEELALKELEIEEIVAKIEAIFKK